MSNPTALDVPNVSGVRSSKERNLPALLRDAERRVNAHVFKRGGDDSLASIPANVDRDVDLLLIEAADTVERLTRERDDALAISLKVVTESRAAPETEARQSLSAGWLECASTGEAHEYIDAFLALALPRIADLMQADPEDATPDGRELMLLADLADRYEKQRYPEFAGRPVRPHRSGGGPPARELPIEVLPRPKPNRDGLCREGFCSPNKPCVLPAGHRGPCSFTEKSGAES